MEIRLEWVQMVLYQMIYLISELWSILNFNINSIK